MWETTSPRCPEPQFPNLAQSVQAERVQLFCLIRHHPQSEERQTYKE